jgi:hypothetical protein
MTADGCSLPARGIDRLRPAATARTSPEAEQRAGTTQVPRRAARRRRCPGACPHRREGAQSRRPRRRPRRVPSESAPRPPLGTFVIGRMVCRILDRARGLSRSCRACRRHDGPPATVVPAAPSEFTLDATGAAERRMVVALVPVRGWFRVAHLVALTVRGEIPQSSLFSSGRVGERAASARGRARTALAWRFAAAALAAAGVSGCARVVVHSRVPACERGQGARQRWRCLRLRRRPRSRAATRRVGRISRSLRSPSRRGARGRASALWRAM